MTTEQGGLSHGKPGGEAEAQAEVGNVEVGNNSARWAPAGTGVGNSQEIGNLVGKSEVLALSGADGEVS